jgi:hypothetical protein
MNELNRDDNGNITITLVPEVIADDYGKEGAMGPDLKWGVTTVKVGKTFFTSRFFEDGGRRNYAFSNERATKREALEAHADLLRP